METTHLCKVTLQKHWLVLILDESSAKIDKVGHVESTQGSTWKGRATFGAHGCRLV